MNAVGDAEDGGDDGMHIEERMKDEAWFKND